MVRLRTSLWRSCCSIARQMTTTGDPPLVPLPLLAADLRLQAAPECRLEAERERMRAAQQGSRALVPEACSRRVRVPTEAREVLGLPAVFDFDGFFRSRPVLLAPMEDVSDAVFRRACRARGAELCVTEFVHADGLIGGELGGVGEDRAGARRQPHGDPDLRVGSGASGSGGFDRGAGRAGVHRYQLWLLGAQGGAPRRKGGVIARARGDGGDGVARGVARRVAGHSQDADRLGGRGADADRRPGAAAGGHRRARAGDPLPDRADGARGKRRLELRPRGRARRSRYR